MRIARHTPVIAAALAAAALLGACRNPVSGPSTTVTREVKGFDRISVSHGFEVELRLDTAEGLTIEAPETALKHIESTVDGGVLEVSIDNTISSSFSPKKLVIRARSIRGIELSGGTALTGMSRITTPTLDLELSGGSTASLDVAATTTNIDASGGSKLTLRGTSDAVDISSISGGSRLNGFDLGTRHFQIDASGGSVLQVRASERLEVSASGGSSIYYKGRPTISSDLSGGSRVIDAN